MKKSDLRTGMTVKMNNDRIRLVLGNTLIGAGAEGRIHINEIKDDLTSSYGDIMEIYSEPKNSPLCASLEYWFGKSNNILSCCELLWGRNPEIEITVKVNGKETSLKDISEKTLIKIRNS